MLLANYKAFSQKKAITNQGDTVVLFTIPQAKKILKQQYELKELKELDTLNRAIIQQKDSVIVYLKESNNDLETALNFQKNIIEDFRGKLKEKDRVIFRQKRIIKIISATGTIIIIALLI